VVTIGATRDAKLQSNRHHRQIDTQLFTDRMPFLSPKQQCQSSEGKIARFTKRFEYNPDANDNAV